MNIQAISSMTTTSSTSTAFNATSGTTNETSSAVAMVQNSSSYDTYTANSTSTDTTGIYTPSPNTPQAAIDIAQLTADRMASFQNMITKMAGGQVNAFAKSTYINLNVTAEESAAAQKSIEEGGEWSPENVANNLLDMAKALSGGDAEKIDLLMEAVEKGFAAATSSWGDELPEISQKTYDLVMQGFEDWRNEANGTTTEVEAE